MDGLGAISGDASIMQQLWPKIFNALQLPVPSDPLPPQPSVQQLWPILARSVKSEGLLRSGQIMIKVKTLTSKDIPLKVKLSDNIAHVKNLIQDKEGMPPDQQRIFGIGRPRRQLHDDELLGTCGFYHDCTAHLILRF